MQFICRNICYLIIILCDQVNFSFTSQLCQYLNNNCPIEKLHFKLSYNSLTFLLNSVFLVELLYIKYYTIGYAEGGGLYALGLIHANHGGEITDYLLGRHTLHFFIFLFFSGFFAFLIPLSFIHVLSVFSFFSLSSHSLFLMIPFCCFFIVVSISIIPLSLFLLQPLFYVHLCLLISCLSHWYTLIVFYRSQLLLLIIPLVVSIFLLALFYPSWYFFYFKADGDPFFHETLSKWKGSSTLVEILPYTNTCFSRSSKGGYEWADKARRLPGSRPGRHGHPQGRRVRAAQVLPLPGQLLIIVGF